jgi:hypothetical protein
MLPEMRKPLADDELFKIFFWFLLHVPAEEIVSYKPDICIIGGAWRLATVPSNPGRQQHRTAPAPH